DVKDVLQFLQRNRSVHTQVRTRALGRRSFKLYVDSHGAVEHRRIDAGYASVDYAIVGINFRELPDEDVLCLRFGYLQFRLEMVGLDDLRQYSALGKALPDLYAQLLQDACDPGANLQSFILLVLELRQGTFLIDGGLLHVELGVDDLGVLRDAVLLDLESCGQFFLFRLSGL